jgi:hypothetical protein
MQFIKHLRKGQLINRPVGKKPSETRDKPHFQRHSCPGPDFRSENGKNAVSSRNPPAVNGIFAIFSQYFI